MKFIYKVHMNTLQLPFTNETKKKKKILFHFHFIFASSMFFFRIFLCYNISFGINVGECAKKLCIHLCSKNTQCARLRFLRCSCDGGFCIQNTLFNKKKYIDVIVFFFVFFITSTHRLTFFILSD